jgi:hexosaminidase
MHTIFRFPPRISRLIAILLGSPVLFSCQIGGTPAASPVGRVTPSIPPTPGAAPVVAVALGDIIPKPVSAQAAGGAFSLTAGAGIFVEPATPELTAIGEFLAEKLRPATGFALPVAETNGAPAAGNIYLTTVGADSALGGEGYTLAVTPDLVALVAPEGAGLFYGVQTIRQLLPPAVDSPSTQPGPWAMATGVIRDYPRFAWRGAMLDVARHFFGAADIKKFIDRMAYYKLNRFHLHLTDDQGWRLVINAWPQLALHGGSAAVGGDPGGYFTQEDYADIVAYARTRYVTVIPEIDMPGHTNAALASYVELNCDRVAPPLHTGIETGFSTLCVQKDITYTFIDDVIREVAALTPGPYIHIGGDEVSKLAREDYILFLQKAQAVVTAHGKQMIGWGEIAPIDLLPTTIVQHWDGVSAAEAGRKGSKIIMSPAAKIYLDMKYDSGTRLGLNWAGNIEVQDAYAWDPAGILGGVTENMILGVEAPLWTETIRTAADLEYMVFPRLLGCAEIGWTPQVDRRWDEYKLRLGAQGPRLTALGVMFYRSAQVPWQ